MLFNRRRIVIGGGVLKAGGRLFAARTDVATPAPARRGGGR